MVKNRDDQVDLGAYYTPPKTVSYLLSVLGHDHILGAKSIVEPAGGDGVFVHALLELGVEADRIQVWDIDPDTEASIDALGAEWSLGDTLARDLPLDFVDVVVGNPPYLNKRSSYIRENKTWLAKKFSAVGASEAYVMFSYEMARVLRPKGRLGFVLSDTCLSLGTHQKFRDWLLQHTKIVEISLAPSNLFNAAVSTVILVVERCDDPIERDANLVRFFDRASTEDDYGSADLLHFVRQIDLQSTPNHAFGALHLDVLRLFRDFPSLVEAGLTGHIGMHTKDNGTYLQAAATDPAGAALQRAQVKSGQLMPYLKTGGIADYWAPIREFLLWDKASRAVYSIPTKASFGKPGVAISGISARLSARILEPGCYWDTNKVMGFQNDTGLTDATVVGLLNSQLYNYLAKGVLNTTASLQIADIRRLPLIELKREESSRVDQIVSKLVRQMRRGTFEIKDERAARAEIDRIVCAAAGIDDNLRDQIASFWKEAKRGRTQDGAET